MKSQEFIRRCVSNQEKVHNGKIKQCSSILFDGTHVYSYGTHYPLLIQIHPLRSVNPAWILNDRGYSPTTGKHISWAGQYADYRVEIPRTFSTAHATSPEGIAEAARLDIAGRRFEIDSLRGKIKARPKYTATYTQAIDRLQARIDMLENLFNLCIKSK